eukprot:TRINITY_DN40136_c0_g1_i1.p1 TRINITY_DN40136_c0_g1~~TRINITY_DN40136_c0_g1_i1.p1  ORF type:complete len:290 (-),score=50.69 TRINITY_DN40136_c0_g1_i1:120-989(-)
MAWELVGPPQDLVAPLLLPQVGDVMAAPLGMVATALRHAPLVILLMLQLSAAAGASSPEPEETCSKALGFNESSGPKDRSSQDLQFCQEHHKRTCCERNTTRQVLSSFAAFAHERSGRCAVMSRLALCSLCDGDVGIGAKVRDNMILLCPSFCKRWFEACADDFFAPGKSGAGSVAPCTPGSLVCSPLREISEDPASFCAGVGGFAVAPTEDDEDSEERCYDGVPSAQTKGKATRAHWERPRPKEKPWWRRLLDRIERVRLPYWVEANAPAMIVACVAIVIAWFLVKGD